MSWTIRRRQHLDEGDYKRFERPSYRGAKRTAVVTYCSGFHCRVSDDCYEHQGRHLVNLDARSHWCDDKVCAWISLSSYAIEVVRFCKLSTRTVGRVQVGRMRSF